MYANLIDSVFFAKEYRTSEFTTADVRRRSQPGLVDRRPPGAGQRPEPRNRRLLGRPIHTTVGRLAVVAATFVAVVSIAVAIVVTSGGDASASTPNRYGPVSVSSHPTVGLQHTAARHHAERMALISRWRTN